MPEDNLNSNDKHPIIRIGDTVHRPTHWWTPAVHDLLKYLESIGFEHSPRVLGFDEQGREILTFMEGESGKEGWAKIVSDEGLRNYARFLRKYHDAIAGYHPSVDSEWAYATGAPKEGEIMCHGDFGVWNLVWEGNKPVGIIDWDFVLPAPATFDVLYALEYSAPFRDDETCIKWHAFTEVPDRKHRIEVFTEAYGAQLEKVTDKVAQMQRKVGTFEKYLAERGLQPQVDWVANGDLEEVEKRAKWTEENGNLFE